MDIVSQAALFGFFVLLTVFGNGFVILSVVSFKPLHNVHNYYLASLAISDLTVALFIMPLAAAYVTLDKWIFGATICKLWLVADVLCCTASIWNLCAIACDRYFALSNPVDYAQKRTAERTLVKIALVWLISSAVSVPALFGWNDWEGKNLNVQCNLNRNLGYVIYSAAGSFYIPLIIMTTLYVKIYRAVKRQVVRRTSRYPCDQNKFSRTTPVFLVSARNTLTSYYPNGSILGSVSDRKTQSLDRGVPAEEFLNGCQIRRKISLSKERKAVRVMTIIMIAFVVCWLPFFIAYLAPLIFYSEVPKSVETLIIWLGYANSAINPLVYTIFNNDFRLAFKRIVLCKHDVQS